MLVKAVMVLLMYCWLEGKSDAVIICQLRNALTPWS
jgi:hypothetical protein